MIITPYSVVFSVLWGSICLILLRISYRFLLRHNCFKLVLFLSYMVIFRLLFVVDLPVKLPDGLLRSLSEFITLCGKKIFDYIPVSSLLVSETHWIHIGNILLSVWLTVAAALLITSRMKIKHITQNCTLARVSEGNVQTERILQQIQLEMNTDFRIKIIQNSYIHLPFVRGLRHPVIYIGNRLKEEEISLILLHEVIHVKNHDNWVKSAFHIIKLILWWNPFVWLLSDIFEDVCEYRCDNMIAENMNEISKLHYASLINKFSLVEINNAGLLKSDSAYAYKKEKDYIFQRISAFLKPKPLNFFAKMTFLSAVTFTLIGSIIFCLPTIEQKSYLSSARQDMQIDESSSFLLSNGNGSYSLYNYGLLIDNNIKDTSNYNLPIKEETK